MNNMNTNNDTQSIKIHCSIASKTEICFDVFTDNDCMALSEFGFSSKVLLNCDASYANRNWNFIYGERFIYFKIPDRTYKPTYIQYEPLYKCIVE